MESLNIATAQFENKSGDKYYNLAPSSASLARHGMQSVTCAIIWQVCNLTLLVQGFQPRRPFHGGHSMVAPSCTN